MPRVYRLSADTSEKEKAVGGILTFAQAGWVVLGLVVFAGAFTFLARIMDPSSALILAIIPGAALAVPFAFWKRDGLTLTQYLIWDVKFHLRKKHLVNTMAWKLDRPQAQKPEGKGARK